MSKVKILFEKHICDSMLTNPENTIRSIVGIKCSKCGNPANRKTVIDINASLKRYHRKKQLVMCLHWRCNKCILKIN